MLALIALAATPLSLPADGWVAFEQPAVSGTATLGCIGDREVSLGRRDNGWNMHDDEQGARFDRFTVYLAFERGELSQVRGYTPDCRVRDEHLATRHELSAEEGVALLARHLDDATGREHQSRLLGAIAHIDTADADTVLERIASDIDRADRGHDALFWLAMRRGEHGRSVVREHLDAAWPMDHRKQALMALALSGKEDALETVRHVAREDANAGMRAHAVTALGIVDAPGAFADVHSIFISDDGDEVRRQVIFALAQLDNEQAARALADIVRDARFAAHRRDALFWLSNMEGEASETVRDELFDEIL